MLKQVIDIGVASDVRAHRLPVAMFCRVDAVVVPELEKILVEDLRRQEQHLGIDVQNVLRDRRPVQDQLVLATFAHVQEPLRALRPQVLDLDGLVHDDGRALGRVDLVEDFDIDAVALADALHAVEVEFVLGAAEFDFLAGVLDGAQGRDPQHQIEAGDRIDE